MILLLVACGVTVRPTCEVADERDVTDDEVTDLGFSVADVLGFAAGDHAAVGTTWEDDVVDTVVGLARGDGSATYTHTEYGEERTKNGQLFGEQTLDIAVVCVDSVSFPVALTVATADGAIDAAEDAEAVSSAVDRVDAEVHVAPDELEGVPTMTDPVPDEGFVYASFIDGVGASGKLGWEGEDETSAWARYPLEWAPAEE